ncbi:MAG: MTH938/NDUFAF3 family protein [bacterium]
MIDSYGFGHIVVDKIPYKNDVIVFTDRVQTEWWRKEGHKLQLEDIEGALDEAQPRALIVGTGKFGIMNVCDDVKKFLIERSITLYAEPTEKAVKIYNRLILTDDKILGVFHLTC